MGSKFLKVTGILMIIFGSIALVVSIIAMLGLGVLEALGAPMGLLWASGLISLAASVAEFVAGIIGVKNWNKPEKANTCIGWGIAIVAMSIISNVFTLGTIQIDFGKNSAIVGRLEVSTTRMISSLDDAVNECIRVRNLDTYKEGKSEIGEEVTYGDTTYKLVNMSHENGAESCLVSYYKRADGKDIYVEIRIKQLDIDKLTIDDPLVQELAESAVYK